MKTDASLWEQIIIRAHHKRSFLRRSNVVHTIHSYDGIESLHWELIRQGVAFFPWSGTGRDRLKSAQGMGNNCEKQVRRHGHDHVICSEKVESGESCENPMMGTRLNLNDDVSPALTRPGRVLDLIGAHAHSVQI